MKDTTETLPYSLRRRSAEGIPVFEISGLAHAYPDGTRALNGIDLAIFTGDRIALVGCNGSGKTTLAKHLNGLLTPARGRILYHGEELAGECRRQARLEIGMLFQDPDDQLFCNTLDEDVAFGPRNQRVSPKEVERRTVDSLRRTRLDGVRYKAAHLFSYGQKKRAAFATLLSMNPSVLVLDEPTANLDPKQEEFFTGLLREFAGTVICISHDLPFLYRVCNRAVVLEDGRIHHDFSMSELVSHSRYLRDHGLDFSFRLTCCRNHDHSHPHHHHSVSETSLRVAPEASSATSSDWEPVLIRMEHYSYRYPDGTWGLRDLSFAVGAGSRTAVIGENGAGKSTLVSCLAGIRAGSGKYIFNGRPVTGKAGRELWREIGLVFQDPSDQLFCPSCREEIAFGLKRLGLSASTIRTRVEETLEQVRLSGFEDRPPHHLSAGERKRVALAAVLAMHPRVLILDEPTANLDPRGEKLFCSILQDLNITQILISHDMAIISLLCDHILVIHEGEMIRDYPLDRFVADEHLVTVNGLDYTYKNACCREMMDLQNP